MSSIDLDVLQSEAEKLLALLNDRQPGIIAWHEFMKERLESIYDLAAAALGKSKPNVIYSAEIDTDIDPRLPFSGATIVKHARVGKETFELRADGHLYLNGNLKCPLCLDSNIGCIRWVN